MRLNVQAAASGHLVHPVYLCGRASAPATIWCHLGQGELKHHVLKGIDARKRPPPRQPELTEIELLLVVEAIDVHRTVPIAMNLRWSPIATGGEYVGISERLEDSELDCWGVPRAGLRVVEAVLEHAGTEVAEKAGIGDPFYL